MHPSRGNLARQRCPTSKVAAKIVGSNDTDQGTRPSSQPTENSRMLPLTSSQSDPECSLQIIGAEFCLADLDWPRLCVTAKLTAAQKAFSALLDNPQRDADACV